VFAKVQEVIIDVQAMALGMVGDLLGVDVRGHAGEFVLAQAHDPGEQEFTGSAQGRLGESGTEGFDDGVERVYHGPHGGTSVSWGDNYHAPGYEEPPSASPHPYLGACSSVQRKMRKSSCKTSWSLTFSLYLTPCSLLIVPTISDASFGGSRSYDSWT